MVIGVQTYSEQMFELDIVKGVTFNQPYLFININLNPC